MARPCCGFQAAPANQAKGPRVLLTEEERAQRKEEAAKRNYEKNIEVRRASNAAAQRRRYAERRDEYLAKKREATPPNIKPKIKSPGLWAPMRLGWRNSGDTTIPTGKRYWPSIKKSAGWRKKQQA